MITTDAAWGSSYILSHYSRLPYSRVETTDRVVDTFYRFCNSRHIKCEWFAFAGAIVFNSDSVTEKQLANLREEAIDQVRDELVSQLSARELPTRVVL